MASKTYILCPGQGAQAVGMGKDFHEKSPLVRDIFDTANRVIGFDLSSICFNQETPDRVVPSSDEGGSVCGCMINYTERLRVLMQDIVARVEPLSFIDPASFSVFARFGRTGAEGAYATCHCLCMPPSDPGYYFWRNSNGEVTRRSEWFVSKTPEVYSGARRLDYLISFALLRLCEQRLEHTRKRVHYPESTESWIAKLDAVVHELYHIDPCKTGIRQMVRNDGKNSYRCHSP